MAEMRRSRQRLLGGATVLLPATAGLNALGYGQVSERLLASGLEATWSTGLKALWLILRVCALIPTLDAVVLFALAGAVPAVLLALAAILIWVATAILHR